MDASFPPQGGSFATHLYRHYHIDGREFQQNTSEKPKNSYDSEITETKWQFIKEMATIPNEPPDFYRSTDFTSNLYSFFVIDFGVNFGRTGVLVPTHYLSDLQSVFLANLGSGKVPQLIH